MGDYFTYKDQERFIGKVLSTKPSPKHAKVLFLDTNLHIRNKAPEFEWIFRKYEGKGETDDPGYDITDIRKIRKSTKKEIKIYEEKSPEYLMKKIGGNI